MIQVIAFTYSKMQPALIRVLSSGEGVTIRLEGSRGGRLGEVLIPTPKDVDAVVKCLRLKCGKASWVGGELLIQDLYDMNHIQFFGKRGGYQGVFRMTPEVREKIIEEILLAKDEAFASYTSPVGELLS